MRREATVAAAAAAATGINVCAVVGLLQTELDQTGDRGYRIWP